MRWVSFIYHGITAGYFALAFMYAMGAWHKSHSDDLWVYILMMTTTLVCGWCLYRRQWIGVMLSMLFSAFYIMLSSVHFYIQSVDWQYYLEQYGEMDVLMYGAAILGSLFNIGFMLWAMFTNKVSLR